MRLLAQHEASRGTMKGAVREMRQILVVVDMQKDFVDGTLGTKEAVSIVNAVADKIKKFEGEVVFTKDTHTENYLETQEGKHLPVLHCIQGSEGWQLVPQIEAVRPGDAKIFEKPAFGSVELARYLMEMDRQEGIEQITLVGLCTDICVISNAMILKAYLPQVPVAVDKDCCAGVTPQSHQNALEAMKMCQIQVV